MLSQIVFPSVFLSAVLFAKADVEKKTAPPVQQANSTVASEATSSPSAVQAKSSENTDIPAVVSIENANGRGKDAAGLTDRILVRVRNLEQLLKPNTPITSVILFG